MKSKMSFVAYFFVFFIAVLGACKKEEATTTPTTTTTTSNVATSLDMFKKIYGAYDVAQDGDYVVIKTKALPDHKSPYYQGTQWSNEKYEAYNGINSQFNLNPNRIAEQNITFRIPMKPTVASSKTATPLGSIGISLNGVPFYNQYAAMQAPLTGEINSFDQYNGHPQQQGQYHYHVEPTYLTQNKGKTALLGWLLDGFPVYGPLENGKTITNTDLDAYHGHSHATTEYPNGVYHYHFTAESPYLNGSGFYGVAGTVSR